MTEFKRISENVQSVAAKWTELAIAQGWATDREDEHRLLITALLETTIAVLTADGPLNLQESIMLTQVFGSDELIQRAEYRARTGANLLGESLPALIVVVQNLADQSDYRADADPILNLISDIFDAGLAADNFPSESEAWAASRVLGKLRRAALRVTPTETSTRTITLDVSNALDPGAHEPAPEPAAAQISTILPTTTAPTEMVRGLLRELDVLVGLESVKEEVETLVNLARVRTMRADRGLPSPDISFHLVFSGNPGTGKTTVARILGQIYGALGMLSVGKCIEVDRSALIGGYLGQTTTKTVAVLEAAQGSVLFVDEAYSLTDGTSDSYGDEAVSVLLKFMEDHRDTFVLIAAGYTDEMETFLNSNPGLRSRFAKTIHFPDYALDELVEILVRVCRADGYRLDEDAMPVVREQLERLLVAKRPHFANGREARKMYERAIGKQANRIAGLDCSDDQLCVLTAADFR